MEINNIKKDGFMGGIIAPDAMAGHSLCLVNEVICNRAVTSEIGGDFNIPEHMPEMRKLIKVDVCPTTPSSFVSGSGIQLNGGIEYKAVYLGSDGEVYCVPFSGEYSFSVPFNEGVSVSDIDKATVSAFVSPESAVSRVGGARRINIRSRLLARVLALDEKKKDGGAGTTCDGHIQRLINKRQYCTERHGKKDDAEIVSYINALENGVRYLCSECRVFVEDAMSGDGYIDCRGLVSVRHTMSREGELYVVADKIPFSETVEVDGISSGAAVCVKGFCTEISMAPQTVDDISEKMGVTMRICLEGSGFTRGEIECVKDVYSTEFECTPKTEKYTLPVLLACKNGNVTFSATRDLAETGASDTITNIVDVSGTARAEGISFDDGKWTVGGKCRFCVIYSEEEDGISTFETEFPFKYEFEGDGGELDRFDCSVTVMDVRARNDGEKITFDCELALSYYVLGKQEVEVVTETVIGCRREKGSCGFTVCYPDKSDSLWSVAKRYRASVLETAKENGINSGADADSIGLPDGTKYMIV